MLKVYLCVYTYACTCKHTYTYTYMYTYAHTFTHTQCLPVESWVLYFVHKYLRNLWSLIDHYANWVQTLLVTHNKEYKVTKSSGNLLYGQLQQAAAAKGNAENQILQLPEY